MPDRSAAAPPAAFAPRFTVIMPAYNSAGTIARSIESLLAQAVDDWELVVVDDGSTDDTYAIMSRYAEQDPRIRIFRQANAGAGPARDFGLRESSSEFVVLLDSDDRMLPNYLEVMSNLIAEYPGYGIYACNAIREYPEGARLALYPTTTGSPVIREITLVEEITGYAIPAWSVVLREAHERAGGFRPMWGEDYDLWLRVMADGYRAIRTSQQLFAYTVSRDNKSFDHERMARSSLESVTDLSHRTDLAPEVLAACHSRIEELQHHIALIPVKERIRQGDYSGVRAEFIRHRRAMRSLLHRYAVLALIVVSPLLYRRIVARIDPLAKG